MAKCNQLTLLPFKTLIGSNNPRRLKGQ